MEIRVAEYVEFKGAKIAHIPRRVSCFGIDASLLHPPIGSMAYTVTRMEEFVSSNGQVTTGEILGTSGPFILPSQGESYLRVLLGPDYVNSDFSRRKNN